MSRTAVVNLIIPPNHKRLPFNKGMTLIELIIGIALSALIVAAIFSFQIFNLKVFGEGKKKADVQGAINIASETITTQLRYSSLVEILPASTSIPNPVPNDDDIYLFIDNSSGSAVMKMRDKNGDRTLYTFDTCSILFEPQANNTALQFSISGSIGGRSFSSYSDIVPMNMLLTPLLVQDSSGTQDGVAIRFSKALPAVVVGDTVTLPNPPDRNVGVAYSYTGWTSVSVAGFTSPYNYAVLSGTPLPIGLALATNGIITGTPTQSGVFSIAIQISDSSTPTKSVNTIVSMNIIPDSTTTTHSPTVTNVSITGTLEPLLTVTASYTFYDADGDSDNSIITWFISPTQVNPSLTQVGVGNSYSVLSSYVGKHLIVSVLPVSNLVGEAAGILAFSSPQLINAVNSKPKAQNVSISGTPVVGQILTGVYTFFDADNDHEGLSTYAWYRLQNLNDKNPSLISGANSNTYTLTNQDNNKYIMFQVTPKAMTGVLVGDTVLATSTAQISNN